MIRTPPRVLVASTESKYRAKSVIWKALAQVIDFDHEILPDETSLVDFVSSVDSDRYDRVLVNSNMRRIGRPLLRLSGVPGLVIYDYDVCQNNIRHSEWYGRYPAVIKSLGEVRVVVSGARLCKQLVNEGIDARFMPKAYDPEQVYLLNEPRTHDIAFVGRIKNKVYKERRKFLERANRELGAPALRADPGEPYNRMLNSIRFFLSADVGLGEYMIKNFEAMAAGCVLLAYRQHEDEQAALGFEDMHNVVLYSDFDELKDKYQTLRESPELADAIAQRGRELAETRHTWYNRANTLPELLEPPLLPPASPSLVEKFRLLGM